MRHIVDAEKTSSTPTVTHGAPVSPLRLVRPYTAMRDCFRLLAIINLILLPLAVAVYGERFRFFSLALSDLGVPVTPGGLPNRGQSAAR